ncbi:uncharacterized protein CDAR_539051 [Caerostris darwini]|uniref:Ig-like domain-containing protein n=1 Tax=Caerostris darwini TaxID=1538125 RepID=A0AAV4SYK5_9ARAC|nr:uncharacterized protein CDAR_539051 [Caerostris darwini]
MCNKKWFFVFAGVTITRLSMPRWVQNGTEDSVVLDCEYNYSEDDKRLVVKWFLNDDPEPIYQWIPELNQRYASERVRGKLNMDYTVSPSSQHTRYRALNLMKPTTELSGRYSCHVVSMASQDAEDQVMVVYAPPRSFDFNYTKMSSEAVNFTCEADGVFPMPKITLLQVDTPEPSLVSGVKTVTTSQRGAYYVQVSREIRDWELTEEPTVFECVLSIPGTDYENQRKILYFPGMASFPNVSTRFKLSLDSPQILKQLIAERQPLRNLTSYPLLLIS